MAGVLGAASIPFIGCVALLVAMVLQILAFAAPYWVYADNYDFGLWRKTSCAAYENGQEGCFRWDHLWDFLGAWFDAVRAAECLTIIFWAIPLVVLPVYIYVALGLYYRCMLLTMTIFTLLGVIWSIIGFIIFGIKIDDHSEWDIGWCFILAVIACGLGILAFIIFLVASCKRPKFEAEPHFVSEYFVDPYKNQLYVVETFDDPVVIKDNSVIVHPAQVNPAIVISESD